ncbi:reverse transcriptase family protein [Flavobacteriales bacterium]|nr:reverse transcriptase family protein [Flavobacteriales bacterium]
MEAHLSTLLRSGQDVKALTRFLNAMLQRRAEREGWVPWRWTERQVGAMLTEPGWFYRSFTIPKKSGGERHIDAPKRTLKLVQWALVPVFSEMFTPSPHAFGFVKGKGIVGNASVHLGQVAVLNVDIQGFFPSVSRARIEAVFKEGPGLRMSSFMARSIARLCTLRGGLPQGSPASAVLTNLVTVRLDARLAGLAEQFGCRYSRYVDDITLSAPGRTPLDRLLPRLEAILMSEGFVLHPDKTRLQTSSMRQEVTGLVLSGARCGVPAVNAPRSYRRQVRAMLHTWRHHGLSEAAARNGCNGDNGVRAEQAFVRQLQGRVAHMLHVNPTPEVQRYCSNLGDLLALEGPADGGAPLADLRAGLNSNPRKTR